MSEEEKARKKQYLKEYNQKPEVRARRKERDSTPEAIERRKIKDKIHYDKHREKKLAQKKQYYDRTYVRTNRDWRIIINAVREELDKFKSIGINQPTLRAIFYRLFSNGIIHNTEKDYKKLGKNTTIAREQTRDYYGKLPINCFADESREAIYQNNDLDHVEPEDLAEEFVKRLKNLPHDYTNSYVERWLDQKDYVAIWTEKKTMISTFQSIMGNREIDIVPFGGQPSVSFLWDVSRRLKEIQDSGKNIHILYFGDLDPSGLGIQNTIENKLSLYGIDNIDFQRIGVTHDQVEEYDLPTNPDPETLEKLERDSNSVKFLEEYNELFQVEVDALVGKNPEAFTKLVHESIDQYFDEEIHQKVIDRYSGESIRKDIKRLLHEEFPDLSDGDDAEDDDDST